MKAIRINGKEVDLKTAEQMYEESIFNENWVAPDKAKVKICNLCGKEIADSEEFFTCVYCGKVGICEHCQNTAYSTSDYGRIDYECSDCLYEQLLESMSECMNC